MTGGSEPKSYCLESSSRSGRDCDLGGIKSIGRVAGLIVPVMCAMYVLASVCVAHTCIRDSGCFWNRSRMLWCEAAYGGLIGFIRDRRAFSNEAGVGSASIAHSAAATNEPVREGVVALEPFIDTIIFVP